MFASGTAADTSQSVERIGSLPVSHVMPLLDAQTDAPFFVMDRELRFVNANAAMAEMCGARDSENMIGRGAADLFPPHTSAFYENLARRVMRTRRPVRDQLVEVTRSKGPALWLLLGCWPLQERARSIIGVASLGRRLDNSARKSLTYARVAAGIQFLTANFGARIRVRDLAERSGVSVSQVERDFFEVLAMPPTRYVANARFDAAMDMLSGAGSIAEVSHACGYADQSAFTRRFQAAMGMTPSEFRRRRLAEDAMLTR